MLSILTLGVDCVRNVGVCSYRRDFVPNLVSWEGSNSMPTCATIGALPQPGTMGTGIVRLPPFAVPQMGQNKVDNSLP
jgi:hypothetical protein